MHQGKSKVFFAGLRARGAKENKCAKIEKLFEAAGFPSFIRKKALFAVKLHFGERGCDTFINPVFARTVVDMLKKHGAKPFLTDTNTMYKGGRHNSVDHLETAMQHGFSYATIGAPIIIADGLRNGGEVEVEINKKHFTRALIADAIANAGGLIVLSHFKAHIAGGIGGAIKNLAMGCCARQGKREQHTREFTIIAEKCAACGVCLANCPEEAIGWQKSGDKKHAVIDREKCISCGECMNMCTYKAVEMDWDQGVEDFNQRIAEYAYAAAQTQKGRTGYINFLLNITPDCDCVPWSDAAIVPDIGILSSLDPVALDQACFDLVNQQRGFANSNLQCNHEPGEDKFRGANPKTMGHIQLSYAEEIGLGSTGYELVSI